MGLQRDYEDLIESVIEKVKEHSGVTLERGSSYLGWTRITLFLHSIKKIGILSLDMVWVNSFTVIASILQGPNLLIYEEKGI